MSIEKQYTQAFNDGYILAQHKSELLKKISQNLSPINDYLEGFLAGKEQHEFESTKEKLLQMEELRNKFFKKQIDQNDREI